MKLTLLIPALIFFTCKISAQDAKALLEKVKEKYNTVKDYEAKAKMKTNVVFIKAPVADIKIYYKNPDKMKIKNESGISFIPKGSVNISMGNIFTMNNYTAIESGTETVKGKTTKVIKVLPEDESSEVVLSTLYIDEESLLILKSKTTTKENGTYELEMDYGKFSSYGLPDKLRFTFNTKDYKLPKGVTFDYDSGSAKEEEDKMKNKKGTIEITYSSYTINKGISDDVFK